MKTSWHVGECGDCLYYVLGALVPLYCSFLFTSNFLYIMLLPVCIMFLWMCMYAWWNKIFVQALHSVIPCWKKSMKCCRMGFFKDHYQVAQAIKCSYNRHLVLACAVIGKYVFYEMWYHSSWLSISSLRTLIWDGPIFVQYCLSFSTALVQQLLLWHLHWLVSVQSLSDLCIDKCCRHYTSCLVEALLHSLKHVSIWMTSARRM
jgi:hypothetical protein